MYSVAQMSTLFGVRQQGFEATVLDDRSQPIPSSSNIVHLHMMTKVIMRVFGVLVLVLAFTFFTAACYAAYQAPKWSGKPRPKGSICDRRFVLFLRKSSAQSVNPNLVNLIQSVAISTLCEYGSCLDIFAAAAGCLSHPRCPTSVFAIP